MAFDNQKLGHDSVDNPQSYSPYAEERARRQAWHETVEEPKKTSTTIEDDMEIPTFLRRRR